MLDPNQGFSCQESAFGTKNESDAELTESIIRKYTFNFSKIYSWLNARQMSLVLIFQKLCESYSMTVTKYVVLLQFAKLCKLYFNTCFSFLNLSFFPHFYFQDFWFGDASSSPFKIRLKYHFTQMKFNTILLSFHS